MLSHFTQILILVRHGKTKSTEEDPTRPLSTEGMAQAERMASWLADLNPEIDEVWHSGKPRAQQTAYVIATRLGLKPSVVRGVSGMKPNDDPEPLVDDMETETKSLVIVAHLPFLERVASSLLAGDGNRVRLRFANAGAVVLARVAGSWQLVALLSPEMV